MKDYIIDYADTAKKMAKEASVGFTEIYCLASSLYERLEPGDMENLEEPDDYTNFFLAKALMEAITNFDGIFNVSCSIAYLSTALNEYPVPPDSSNVIPIS